MSMENETAGIEKNSIDQQKEVQAAYEKGRKVGRIEGMLTYQRHLLGNLQKDNEKLSELLAEVMA